MKNRYIMRNNWNWKRFWLNTWHAFTGHPKKDCHKVSGISVMCKCGEEISLSDYY